jgi:hypothetical protein
VEVMKKYVSTGGVYEDGYVRNLKPYRAVCKHEEFEKNGYFSIPGLIADPENLKVEVPEERGQINFHNNRFDRYSYEPVETQVVGSLARYNIPTYKELHYLVKGHLEKNLGMDLHPTYFYDRFYFVGQQLLRHSDRPACEVSVTLQISSNHPDDPWPIWFERPDGTESYALMNDGDAVVYKGCEREHWRDPLPSKYNKAQRLWRKVRGLADDTYHHQIFLHYVDANGPFCHMAGDSYKG